MTFGIEFWGVRGSIACPSPSHIKYGGNTSCLEARVGDKRLILDAGTGIRELGQTFLRTGVQETFLLLTHTHWDHINGFPFFEPAYNEDCKLHIMAGHLDDNASLRDVLSTQMSNPMFPVPMEAMRADLTLEDFECGETLELIEGLKIRTGPLNHPNGATGYRLDYGGKSACYITDTEHVPGQIDENIVKLIEGADVVIYDSTYTEQEYPNHVGWGHSTWNEGVRLCQEAGAKKLVIFHHDPNHDDAFMDEIARESKEAWDATVVAREGMDLTIGV